MSRLDNMSATVQATSYANDELQTSGEPPGSSNELAESELEVIDLTPEDWLRVESLARQIDLGRADFVRNYGAATQRKMANLIENMTYYNTQCDMQRTQALLQQIQKDVRDFNERVQKDWPRWGFFQQGHKRKLQESFQKTMAQMELAKRELLRQKSLVKVGQGLLTQTAKKNRENLRVLSIYIEAGERKVRDIQNRLQAMEMPQAETLPLQKGEEKLGSGELRAECGNLKRRLNDLKLTRLISYQLATQVRANQAEDEATERWLGEMINATLPLWIQNVALNLRLKRVAEGETQAIISELATELLEVSTKRQSKLGTAEMIGLERANQELLERIEQITNQNAEQQSQRNAAIEELIRARESLKRRQS